MEVDLSQTDCEEDVVNHVSCNTHSGKQSCSKIQEEIAIEDSHVVTTNFSHPYLSSDQDASMGHLRGHNKFSKRNRKRQWHNYKSAKCHTACFSCRQSYEEETRKVSARKEYNRRRAESLKRLLISIKKVDCKIRCSDIMKELLNKKVAVKVERVMVQQKANVKQKTTLVKKVSLKNSVKNIKRQCRKKKKLTNLQKPKTHDELQVPSPSQEYNDQRENSAGCDSPPCDDDHWLICMQCNDSYHGECPDHGPALHICTKDVLGTVETTRARASLPDCLHLKESSIPDAGTGVFANIEIFKGVRFGPYAGEVLVDDVIDSGYQWEIVTQKQVFHYLDGDDENLANWLRFVNCARTETEQNLIAVQYRSQIYYYSYKKIYPGQELLVWYGNQFAESLGLVEEDETKSTRNENSRRICTKCCYIFPNRKGLTRHERSGCIIRDKCWSCVQHLMDGRCLKSHMELLSKQGACLGTGNLTTSPQSKPSSHVSSSSEFVYDRDASKSPGGSGNELEENFCSLCSLKLQSVESYQSHMRLLHQQVDLWRCPDCNRRLVLNINHLQLVDGPEHTDGMCKNANLKVRALHKCNRLQPDRKCLPFPFACFRCRRGFSHQIEAMDHTINRCKYKRKALSFSTAAKLTSISYYLCDFPFCGAQFATSTHRTNHFRSTHLKHSNVKKLNASDIKRLSGGISKVCSICDAEIFNEKSFLKHMRRVHGVWDCQIKQKKSQFKAFGKCKKHVHRSYDPQKSQGRFGKDYLVGKQLDFIPREKNSVTFNKSLFEELQDMRVSSSEMYLTDNTEKSLTGISEFCLRGEIPQDDSDWHLTRGFSESIDALADHNDDASPDYTGDLVVDESNPPVSPFHFSSCESKGDMLEANIFNKLFSDLLKDNSELDAFAEKAQLTNYVSSSPSPKNIKKILGAKEMYTTMIDSENAVVDEMLEEQQLTDSLTSQSISCSSDREKNQTIDKPSSLSSSLEELAPSSELKSATIINHASQTNGANAEAKTDQCGSIIVSQNDLGKDLIVKHGESHSIAAHSSTKELHASSSFAFISAICGTNKQLGEKEHLSLPDLEDVIVGIDDATDDRSVVGSPSSGTSGLGDGTSGLEKLLNYQPMSLSSTSEFNEVVTDSKDIGNPFHQNLTDLSVTPVLNSESSPHSSVQTLNFCSSSLLQVRDASSKIVVENETPLKSPSSEIGHEGATDTSSKVALEGETPLLPPSSGGGCKGDTDPSSKITLENGMALKNPPNGIGYKGDPHNCVHNHDGADPAIVSIDKIFECNQAIPAKANKLNDFNNNAREVCHIRTKQFRDLNESISREESTSKQEDFNGPIKMERDKSFAKIYKNSDDSSSLNMEVHPIENSIRAEVLQVNRPTENAVKPFDDQIICGEVTMESKSTTDLFRSKEISNEKDLNPVLSDKGFHFEKAALGQCNDGSDQSLENVDFGDDRDDYGVDGCDDSSDDRDDNVDDDINLDLENDIILAIKSYMTKANVSMDTENCKGGDLRSVQDTEFTKANVSSQNSQQNHFSLKARDYLVDGLSFTSKGIKDACRKKLKIKQLGLSDMMTSKSESGLCDLHASGEIMYQDWLTERPRDSVVTNNDGNRITSRSFAKDNTESHELITDSGNDAVDRPRKRLHKDASELSSDQIRMELKHHTSSSTLTKKVNEVPTLKSDCFMKNNARASNCSTVNLPKTLSLTLSTVSKSVVQPVLVAHSSSTISSSHSTLIQTGAGDSSPSPTHSSFSNGKVNPHPYCRFSSCQAKQSSPQTSLTNGSVPVTNLAERDNTRWRDLLKDCGGSPVNDAQPHLVSYSNDKKLAGRKEERKKVQRKSLTFGTCPQPLFAFHKLNEVTARKKKENRLGEGKSLNVNASDEPRERSPDLSRGKEIDEVSVPGDVNLNKSSNSLGLRRDKDTKETSTCKASCKQDEETSTITNKKRKNSASQIKQNKNIKKRRTSTGSCFKKPIAMHSIAEVNNTNVGPTPIQDSSFPSNSGVHSPDTVRLLSDCSPINKRFKPRFMRSKSCDMNLEKKLEQSLLSAENLVVELPEKYRTLGSNSLTTICSETFSDLLKLDLCSDLDSATCVGSTHHNNSESASSSSENEVNELERRISRKRTEMRKLVSAIRDVQTSISLRQSLRVRKRYRLKIRSFIPIDRRELLKRRYKDISDNDVRQSAPVVKNLRPYHKINKFESKKLVVHLETIGSENGSRDLISRSWWCNDCSTSFKIRPCAVSLSSYLGFVYHHGNTRGIYV